MGEKNLVVIFTLKKYTNKSLKNKNISDSSQIDEGLQFMIGDNVKLSILFVIYAFSVIVYTQKWAPKNLWKFCATFLTWNISIYNHLIGLLSSTE